jgi:hypothetical protein
MTPVETSSSNEYTLSATFAAIGETEAQNALPAAVLQDEACAVRFLDGPRRREAASGGHGTGWLRARSTPRGYLQLEPR